MSEEKPETRAFRSKVVEVTAEYAVMIAAWSIALGFVGLAAKAWQWVLFP